ncbi:MAG TPA: hypothetical protein VMS56_13750 [Thermoanaerobaculia bacterium]|nr:hypothetical protein [Thermoanaerobaculia bacterium]
MAESGWAAERRRLAVWLVPAGIVLLLLLGESRPSTPWLADEAAMLLALEEWNPSIGQPPPPGSPLWVGIAGMLAPLAADPYALLVWLSIAATLLALIAVGAAAARIGGTAVSGLVAAVVFAFSPAMLVHGAMAIPDPVALALLAFALLRAVRLMERRDQAEPLEGAIFAAAAAGAIGVQPHYWLAAVPLALLVVIRVRSRRARLALAGTFLVVTFLWIAPLVRSLGGVGAWLGWMRGDGGAGSAGSGVLERAVRFILDPWGPLWLSIPVLLLAAAGSWLLGRAREPRALAPAILGLPYLLALVVMGDPEEAARWSLPALIAVAVLEGAALGRVGGRRARWLISGALVLWAAGSVLHVRPILAVRSGQASPPARAAAWISRWLGPEEVVAYDRETALFARGLIRDRETLPLDEALGKYARRGETRLWLLAEGRAERGKGAEFAWPSGERWARLTPDEGRVVSINRVDPLERFDPLEGVYPIETGPDGSRLRWLAPEATLLVPRAGSQRVQITLALPEDDPRARNEISFHVDGVFRGAFALSPGNRGEAVFRIPEGGALTIASSESVRAPDGSERGVMLIGFRQLP